MICCLAHTCSAFKHTNNGCLTHVYSACAPCNLVIFRTVRLLLQCSCSSLVLIFNCNFNEMYKSVNTNQKHIYTTTIYNNNCYTDYYNTFTVNDSTSHVSFLHCIFQNTQNYTFYIYITSLHQWRPCNCGGAIQEVILMSCKTQDRDSVRSFQMQNHLGCCMISMSLCFA